jgi:hypothetical protein
MGILLFELFRNPLFMGILNKWETLVINILLFYGSYVRLQGAALVAVRQQGHNEFIVDGPSPYLAAPCKWTLLP